MGEIFVGQEFSTFAELSAAVDEYQKQRSVQFWRRDSRTVESAAKRVTRPLSTELVYYDVRYCCIHGGKEFKKRGTTGKETSTFKKGCGAFIHLSANEDGNALVVRKINDEHNHDIVKAQMDKIIDEMEHSELFTDLPMVNSDKEAKDEQPQPDTNDANINTCEHDQILLEPFTYLCQISGKEIRTQLSVAFNYWLQIPENKLSIIIELTQLLHNASLLIDDIEDGSLLRRGIPAAHHIYGVAHTINTANYVYFLGLQKALTLDHPMVTEVFTEQLLELHRGQGMDIYWRDAHICPTEEEYKKMVIRKTGGLFGLAVRMMQLFSENESEMKPLLDNLGLYFQIRDDYANLKSTELEANKGYAEDLTEGKFSFPLIHGIRSHPENNQIMSILRQKTTEKSVKKYCIDYLEAIGSFEYTRQVLVDLEIRLLEQITALGGNPHLTSLIERLRLIYQDS